MRAVDRGGTVPPAVDRRDGTDAGAMGPTLHARRQRGRHTKRSRPQRGFGGTMRRLGRSFWAVAVLSLPLAGPLYGQDAATSDTISLSLPEAVDRALEQSEEVRLARSQVALASAQIGAARSAILPQLNANV